MQVAAFEEKPLEDETIYSKNITLQDYHNVHGFEYKITGDRLATVVITVYTSISGGTWISNGVKANGVGTTSGPENNGSDIVPLRLKPGDLIRFKVVVIGTVVLSLWFTQK